MRKNDEGYPRPEGNSGRIETQNRYVSCLCSFIRRIKNVVFQSTSSNTFWTTSSQINLMLIMKVELIYFQVAYQGKRMIGSMSFIKLLIQQLGLSKMSSITSHGHSNQRDHSQHQVKNELYSDCDQESESLSNSLNDYLNEQEERQQLELEQEMKRLFMTEGEDGFSPFDKSILRMNSPIPGFYDKEDWTQEEIDQYSQTQNEVEEGKIVRYVPGLGWVVDES